MRIWKRSIAMLLGLILMIGLFPVSAFAEEVYTTVETPALLTRFVCDETTAYVTVYTKDGVLVVPREDGFHHLVPGLYYYSAQAYGYEQIVGRAFIVPEDAVGDQELRITMIPLGVFEQEPYYYYEEEPYYYWEEPYYYYGEEAYHYDGEPYYYYYF